DIARVETGAAVKFCVECSRSASNAAIIEERWGYWLSGGGALLLYCPRSAARADGHAGAATRLR
ncbi:MAG TPA: hypothetical protein VGC78_08535, partial [Gaiellaceae bacterium]